MNEASSALISGFINQFIKPSFLKTFFSVYKVKLLKSTLIEAWTENEPCACIYDFQNRCIRQLSLCLIRLFLGLVVLVVCAGIVARWG